MSDQEDSKSWLEKLSLALNGEPSSRSELLDLLRSAERRELLDSEALGIIEGALSTRFAKEVNVVIQRTEGEGDASDLWRYIIHRHEMKMIELSD